MARMQKRVHHPIFARLLPGFMARAEALGQGAHRKELLTGLSSKSPRSWADYGMPVVICMSVFYLLNFLWNLFGWPYHNMVVYMIGGGFLSLALIARALRDGTLTPRALGLASDGWKPQHRVFGLTLIVLMGYGGFATLPNVAAPPSFADYCFWFVFLLPASLAELLVFVSIGFCLPERWLRQQGLNVALAAILAAVFSGVTFGVYHYTHESRWHQFALFPLIPVMWINLVCFTLTRNFHLTLVLHNAFAAVGFTAQQYQTVPPDKWMNPQTYQDWPGFIPLTLICFVVPYFILHGVEWFAGIRSAQTGNSSEGMSRELTVCS